MCVRVHAQVQTDGRVIVVAVNAPGLGMRRRNFGKTGAAERSRVDVKIVLKRCKRMRRWLEIGDFSL